MKNILIFKTDRIGDLLNISPVLYNLNKNFPKSKISLVCSKYNSSLTKYYSFLNKIFIYEKPFIFFLLKNYRFFFLKRYDLILQLDGKNHSYLSTFFIRSKKKVGVKFIKNKKFFGLSFSISRPNYFISIFFNFLQKCIEDYNVKENKSYHYLSLYLKILENLNINIFSKDHFLPFNTKNYYLYDLPDSYYHFHIDERWSFFDENVYINLEKKIENLSKFDDIVISCNLNGNNFYNRLYVKFKSTNKIHFKNNTSVDSLIYIIFRSHTAISSHTGFIVHVAASFKKKIIDIVPSKKFNELDRWIPFNSNYLRLDLNNFLNVKF